MKKICIGLLLLMVTSCSGSTPGETNGEYEVIEAHYKSKTIPCVVWDGNNAGGIDCDWSAQ